MGSIPKDPGGQLAAMGIGDLLITYGNWRGRFIAVRPRTMHVSRELATALPGSGDEAAVRTVLSEIAAGADLTPRLSTEVDTVYVPQGQRSPSKPAPDLDTTLAHDGLHHLHLGAHTGGRFVERTKELLFVAFRPGDAYVVGVYPHGAWGRRELLERVVRNWPNADLLVRMPGITAVTQSYSDEERWQLMQAGVSLPVEIDGSTYFAPGQTVAGTPLAVTQPVKAFLWELECLRKHGLDERLRQRGADPTVYWVPRVRNELAGLESSQGFLALGRLAEPS